MLFVSGIRGHQGVEAPFLGFPPRFNPRGAALSTKLILLQMIRRAYGNETIFVHSFSFGWLLPCFTETHIFLSQ